MRSPKATPLKRVLAGMLAAVMCLGFLPAGVVTAHAAEEVTDRTTLYIQTVNNTTGAVLDNVAVKIECTTAGQYKDYGTVRSSNGGRIALENMPVGFYRITGIRAPEGYRIETTPEIVHLQKSDTNAPVTTVVAYAERPLVIKKISAATLKGLQGAHFKVTDRNGDVVAEGVTDEAGYWTIPFIKPGDYLVTETQPPVGHHISDPQSITITESGTGTPFLCFTDSELNVIAIRKTDKETEQPLAGAHFQLTTAEGGSIPGGNDIVTGKDGMAYLPNLAAGNYKLTETQAPDGYLMDQRVVSFTLTQENETRAIPITNSRPGGIMVYSKDSNGNPLAGTHFVVYDKDNHIVGQDKETNESGYVVFENLDPGTYTVVATKATPGYVLQVNTKQVTVQKNRTSTETFISSKQAGLLIICKDDTGKVVPGATFTIQAQNGKLEGPYTTGSDGTIKIDGLNEGNYVITQTGVPDGYVITHATQSRWLSPDYVEQATFIVRTKPYIEISHYIKGTKTPLAGGKFELWKNNQKIEEAISGQDGRVVFDELMPGTYTVRHTETPNGYTIDTPSQDITVQAANSGYLQFTSSKDSSILITKVDKDTEKPLAGAVFQIRDLQGQVLETVTTLTDGTAMTDTLPAGQYVLSEVRAPEGYVIDESSRIVTVVANQISEQRFTNRRMSAIVVHAVDVSGAPVKGAVFNVTSLDTGKLVDTITSDEAGVAVTKALDPGRYVVREISAPEGYVMETKVLSDVQVSTNTAASLTFLHSMQSVIQIRNEDSKGNPISGGQFKVTERDTGYVVGFFTTDESGMVSTPILSEGVYEVSQVVAADGYVSKNETYTVTVVHNKATIVRFVNDTQSILNIKKTDAETGEPLAGAVFTLADESGHVVGRYTTDASGCVSTQPLAPGSYLLREYKAPDGYLIDESCKTNVVIKADEPTYVSMTNSKKPVIQITKEDAETGELLSGAEFEIKNERGDLVGTYVTNIDGLATTNELTPGTYTVSETKAPQGYALNPTPYSVVVRAGVVSSISVPNSQNAGLTVTKVNEQGNPLAGAEFVLYNMKGTQIAELTTQVNGVATCLDLEAGNYILREVKAPDGYKLQSAPTIVQIKANTGASVKITNKSLSSIVIKKTDADTGVALSGAVFEVTNSAGNVINTLRTDNTGFAQTGKLEDGTYYVKETVAPTGYMVDTSVRTVEVRAGETQTLNITNSVMAAVHIHLNDAVTNDGLSGGTFVIKDLNGVTVGTGKTENGLLMIPSVPDGQYVVSQVAAPDGYIKDTITQNIQVISNKVTHVYFLNQPMTGLIIENVVVTTHNPLAGGVFEVYNAAGKQVYHGTTDDTGVLNTGILTPGKYTIKQVATAKGYTIVTNTQTVTVTVEKPTTAVFENRPHTTLLINKVDSVTREPLEGAQFRVQTIRGEFETVVSTNEGGIATVDNLTPGYYIVTEIKAPDGYILKQNYQLAYLTSKSNAQVTFTNDKFAGLVIEHVILDSHEPLAGGKFEVWELNTEKKVFEGTTDNTGVLQTNIQAPGKYLIKHLATADGYSIVTATQTVEVKVNEATHAVFNVKPMSTLEIRKVDAKTRDPLAGAEFKVVKENSTFEVSVTTDETGVAHLSNLEPGRYIVTETRAPEGYRLNNVSQNIEIISGETSRLTFANEKLTGIIIEKTDADTGAALSGAVFEISHENGKVVGSFTTDAAGRIETEVLEPGRYVVKELVAPNGYIKDEAAMTVTVTDTEPTIVPVTNRAMAGITIFKTDATNGQPLSGAIFEVYDRNGSTLLGSYTTDSTGLVSTDIMTPGTYLIKEVKAPEGYLIDTASKTVTLMANKPLLVKFTDTPKPSLMIEKVDATDVSKSLAGATFKVYDSKGTYIGDYTTDEGGHVFVDGLTPGQYKITESKAPEGYVIDSTTRTVTVKAATQTKVTFTNKPETGIIINKVDANTNAPLAGAEFEISALNGGWVNTYVTDTTGMLHTETLAPGKYVVKEVKAPDGYMIDDASQVVEVVAGKATTLKVTNSRMGGIEVKKVDAATNQPLAGAVFELRDAAGNKLDELRTDSTGYAYSKALDAGEYILAEIEAPEGYVIDTTSKTVVVPANEIVKVTVTNSPMSALRIQKVDGKTGESLSGAVFKIVKENGDYVGEFVTERDGLINIPTIEPGRYVITELSAPDGYIVDSTARTVEVKTGVPTVITIENNRTSGIQIRKTVTQTGEPLAGVTFKIKTAEGTLVGNYTTDSMGLIYVSLEPGEYIVQETFAPDGYVIDEQPQFVTVKANEPTVLEITNDKLSNVRIHKIDAETGKGIYGVTFEIKDSKNNYIGTYKTDDQGYIDLSAVLPEGRYVVTETQAANGYILDPIPRTVKVSSSEPTEIIWENSREKGQVKIVKYSAEDNAALNIPAGSRLEGAEFTITTLNGKVVDTIRTNANGEAYTAALDLGTYLIQETKAPTGYAINSKPVQINVTSKNQEIEIEFYDNTLDVGVTIEKRGEAKVRPGNSMKYYLSNISNASDAAVDKFFFVDVLPTDSIRAQTLYTGTWSGSVYYGIEYKTNMYDYRTLATNLNSKVQYSYDLSSQALNLESGEYVTHIRFVFGTVPAGFHEMVSPVLYAYVLPNVPNNYQIINRCEVGAQHNGGWVTAADEWTTLVVRPQTNIPDRLPTTGF